MSNFESKIKQLSLSDLTILRKIMEKGAAEAGNPSKRDEYAACAAQVKEEEARRVRELMKIE